MKLRKIAAMILCTAVRQSLPGSQEWGQAMLRELDFVEGDAAALSWALGSASSLMKARLLPQKLGPLTSLAGVPLRADALMKATRMRTLAGSAGSIFVAIFITLNFFNFPSLLQRIGEGMIVVGALYMLYQVYIGRGRTAPSGASASAREEFYRAELVRQRDFHRGRYFWARMIIFTPGCLLLCFACANVDPQNKACLLNGMVIIVFCIIAVPANLRIARKYQRQIDELDALSLTSSFEQEP